MRVPFVTHHHPPASLRDSLGVCLPCPIPPPLPTCPSLAPNARRRGSAHLQPPTSRNRLVGVFSGPHRHLQPTTSPPTPPTCPSLAPNARQRGSTHHHQRLLYYIILFFMFLYIISIVLYSSNKGFSYQFKKNLRNLRSKKDFKLSKRLKVTEGILFKTKKRYF
jgi:hypothetical protein